MSELAEQLRAIAPAVAFLLAGVPLAWLLDRLGFFDAVADTLARRYRSVPVIGLWIVAAVTTVVLNLDTTIVLLTPLFIRMARRADVDPLPLAAVPLLLASLASSVLPVSNLTTLIAVDTLHLSVWDVVSHLALPSVVACVVGWLAYRRRYPVHVASGAPAHEPDRRVLAFGGGLVTALLLAFVLGPIWGVEPWMAAAIADLVLMVRLRCVPWRALPIVTAVAVTAVAALVVLVVPGDALTRVLTSDGALSVLSLSVAATVAANVVNNLPALLVAVESAPGATWAFWAWLLGVNAGAVLLPIGALANVLWWRIARDEGVALTVRSYAKVTIPIAGPAVASAIAVLGVERALAR